MPADLRRLTLVGVGVIAAGVVLVLRLRGAETTGARDRVGSGSVSRDRTEPPPRLDPVERVEGTKITRETVTDTARIRDHRAEPRAVHDGSPRAPDTRKIPPQVVHDLSVKLQVGLADCASLLPAQAVGGRPKAEGVVRVDIAGGELQVTAASVQLRDVQGDSKAVANCLEQKWLGQTTSATGVADTTGYSVTVTFALPST